MMPTGFYVLDDNRAPRPARSVIEWGEFFETFDRRRVAETMVGATRVSTVFIGVDLSLTSRARPVLFETMLFTDDEQGGVFGRTATWDEAVEMHAAAVASVEVAS